MRRRRRMLAVTVAALALVLAARPALADLRSGEDKLLHGDYAGAVRELRGLRGQPRAGLVLARALTRTGDFAGAEAAAKVAASAADRRIAEDAVTLLAELERATGRLPAAKTRLEELTVHDPHHLRARCQLGLVYEELGKKDLADPLWNRFFDEWDAGTIDKDSAEQLLYVAIAAWHLGSVKDAKETFEDAVTRDPNLTEANVEWGRLFLEKYAVGEAEQSFEDALAVDPHLADAHAGMARVKLEQSYDVPGAERQISAALEANPRHAGALAVRAQIEIDNEDYEPAKRTLAQILDVNPRDLEAHSLSAAVLWLKDDLAGFEAEKRLVLTLNPRFARLYHVVAEFAEKAHRYPEAIKLEEEGLTIDPDFTAALAAIGTGYLRLGEEKKGLLQLRRAYAKDTFNVRAYNTLNLFDEAIPRSYELTASPHFLFRLPKAEKAVLTRYLPDLMERAFADMSKRYGLTPATTITIELYGDPDHYSVRTVGLPNLGALGVCFGQVITALSPANGGVNWGMVLWHELGHVFAIQLSRSRVPRWFTEGLSEYETIMARPEWRRENDFDVWSAMQAGRLPSVAELNTLFRRAGGLSNMVVAYHLSSLTVEFLGTRWGFPKIVLALRLYGQGLDTAAVLKAVTGLDVPAFDAEFRRHLDERFAPYRGSFRIRPADYDDVTALEKAAAAKPTDADALGSLAVGNLFEEGLDKAAENAKRALAIDPHAKKALYVQAQLAVRRKDAAEARERWNALIQAGGDGYDTRLGLALLAIEAKDVPTVEAELARAKRWDPERSEPYSLLAELYTKLHRDDDALRELERYVVIEQMEYAPLRRLVDAFVVRKQWVKVKELGDMAIRVNPYDAELHAGIAQALEALGERDRAVTEWGTALVCDPPVRRPAVAHLGIARALLAKKDARGAAQAVAEALTAEPDNAEALELKRKIK